MFRSLCTDIAKQLGTEFIVYYNEDVPTADRLHSNGDKTICVFRVVSGSIRPLMGNRGLDAVIQLDFFANIESERETIKIDNAIDMLAANKNGHIEVETRTIIEDGEAVDIVLYKYTANYSVPRTIGNTVIGANSDRYIIKQVNLSVALSADLIFGENGQIYLSDEPITDVNKAEHLIDGVLSWDPSVQNIMTDNAEMGKKTGELIPQYAVKKAVITGLLSENIKTIMENAFTNPQKVYYFMNEITFNSGSSKLAWKVIIENFTPSGVKGTFAGYQMTLAPVPDWLL